ncbi:MAG: hypothetical protein B7C24_04690 [Bacteroidetes bacterium 4572_77]|nr:MAG: hypothetical protein B7C24_04690 [Bacteroidetes bacterium 4572_77]
MTYPEFYNRVPSIVLQDPLSDFLGAFDDGIIEYTYLDVVKMAGHSCPTIAGAYIITLKALQYLYKEEIPQRGDIAISFQGPFNEGVNGVIAQVFSQITGATEFGGFKGIGGKYVRHSLMDFDAPIRGDYKFIRKDTGASLCLSYSPNAPIDSRQQVLMQKIMMGQASPQEKKLFGEIWQTRVAFILQGTNDYDDMIEIV